MEAEKEKKKKAEEEKEEDGGDRLFDVSEWLSSMSAILERGREGLTAQWQPLEENSRLREEVRRLRERLDASSLEIKRLKRHNRMLAEIEERRIRELEGKVRGKEGDQHKSEMKSGHAREGEQGRGSEPDEVSPPAISLEKKRRVDYCGGGRDGARPRADTLNSPAVGGGKGNNPGAADRRGWLRTKRAPWEFDDESCEPVYVSSGKSKGGRSRAREEEGGEAKRLRDAPSPPRSPTPYKYREVIRDKTRRTTEMKGIECPECTKFYDALEWQGFDFNREEFVNKCSRHRIKKGYVEEQTPEDFWRLTFLDEEPTVRKIRGIEMTESMKKSRKEKKKSKKKRGKGEGTDKEDHQLF